MRSRAAAFYLRKLEPSMPRNYAARGTRTTRRTNWLARTSFSHTSLAPGTSTAIELLDASDSSEELANYVAPTLIRTRGVVLIDWDVSLAQATNNGIVGVALYMAQSAVASVFAQAGLTLDNILYSHCKGLSTDLAIASGTESNDTIAVTSFHHHEFVIDIKAMRKFGDSNKLFLLISNLSVTGSVNLAYNYAIRMLIKE